MSSKRLSWWLLVCWLSLPVLAGEFKPIFVGTENPAHKEIATILQEVNFLAELAVNLNDTIYVPVDIIVTFADCGEANAFYDPKKQAIIMCYELVVHFAGMFEGAYENEQELGEAILGATMFTFYHEVGHALVDVLKLPITGREEDAVDQLSTIILLSLDEEGQEPVGGPAIFSAAHWFFKESEAMAGAKIEDIPFHGEHSMEPQRFYNLLCWAYGSNPKAYGFVVADGLLPEARAQRCPSELERFGKAWVQILDKHFKRPAGANVATRPPPQTTPSPTLPPPPVADCKINGSLTAVSSIYQQWNNVRVDLQAANSNWTGRYNQLIAAGYTPQQAMTQTTEENNLWVHSVSATTKPTTINSPKYGMGFSWFGFMGLKPGVYRLVVAGYPQLTRWINLTASGQSLDVALEYRSGP